MGLTDDMLTDSKGAGIMGTLLGLAVILGFGALAVFIFDPRFAGGGETIESIVKKQEGDITYRLDQMKGLRNNIDEAIKNKATLAEWEDSKRKFSSREPHLTEMRSSKESLTKDVATLTDTWEKYKQSYRDAEAKRAVGEAIATITTKDGKTFTNAKFKEVAMNEITIKADALPVRIAYENMPDAWIDRFQITKELVSKARNVVTKTEGAHVLMTSIASIQNRITDCNIYIKEKSDKEYSLNESLQNISAQIDNSANEVAQFDNLIGQEQNKKGINRMAQYRAGKAAVISRRNANVAKRDGIKQEIASTKQEILSYKQEVANLKAKIVELQTPKETEQ